MTSQSQRPRVALFVTCLVDIVRPSVGFAAVRLLEAAGCDVFVPQAQTCCGQPAYNSGDRDAARALALQTIAAFAGFDYVVVPSGSCAAMLKVHYPRLLSDDAEAGARGARLRRAGARARLLPGRRAQARSRAGHVRRARHLPRRLLRPARARASSASRARFWPQLAGTRLDRDGRDGFLLRFRRPVLA